MVKYYSSVKDDDFEDTTCSKENSRNIHGFRQINQNLL